MPSAEHEQPVHLFWSAPSLAVDYLRWHGVAVPEHAQIRLEPGTLQQKHPGGFQVDVLVLLLNAAATPVLAVAIEFQRHRDARKRSSWSLYQSTLTRRYGCPVELLVTPLRRDVARWLRGLFARIRDDRRDPRSTADAAVPAITDLEEARRAPEQAAFSAYWHATMGDRSLAVPVALVALQACGALEPERRDLYSKVIGQGLSTELRLELEDRMALRETSQIGFIESLSFNVGQKKGIEQGAHGAMVRLLSRQIQLKFGTLSDEDRGRLEAATPAELERFSERILEATRTDEVFAP